MEYTWYLYPGQTLENTTPEQRGKALVATPSAWNKITKRIGHKKIKHDLLAKEHARNEYLKEGSKAMTSTWDDTIEKVRERQRNSVENRIDKREAKHFQQYIKLRDDQKQERDNLVNEAKTRLYMSTQEPRNLTNALLSSEIMFERDMQIEFKKYEMEHNKIEEMKEARCIRDNAAKEIIENMEKRNKRKELDKKNNEEVMERIKNMQENTSKIDGERLIAEKAANLLAETEVNKIIDYERQMDKKSKEDWKREIEEMQNMQRKYRAQLKLQDESEEKIIKIYSRAKCRMEEMKKQRVKQMQADMIALRGNMAANLLEQMIAKAENEDSILEKAQREKEAKEDQQAAEKQEYRKQLIKEKVEYIKEVKEKKLKQKEIDKEVQKWEMINKSKTNEVMAQYDKEQAQKIFDEKIKYRKVLQKQMAEKDEDYEKLCMQQVLKYYKEKDEAEDKAYFNYADSVLDLAKSRGRNPQPIHKAIEQYKFENQLQLKKKNLTNLQSNVPINNKKKNCN